MVVVNSLHTMINTAEQIETLFHQFYPEDTALAQPFREAVQAELGDKPVNMAALQHFFIRQMRTPAREVVAHVHTIVEDLNEKDAEASAEQDAKGVYGLLSSCRALESVKLGHNKLGRFPPRLLALWVKGLAGNA